MISLRSFHLVLIVFVFLFSGITSAQAIYDPRSQPNNRVGVHILDPSEIIEAAKLVNANSGSWGYVTVPIRSDQRDRQKWLEFFQNCRKLQVIPIIRLATYVENSAWATPTVYDLVDFANFLADMPWPTSNRYIILFNEPNHAFEWGGHIDPVEYAKLLVNAQNIFKSRSGDFFLLSAGLDMSAPSTATSLDALTYYTRMTRGIPNWLSSVDGLSVHAYPNPAFSAPVTSKTRFGPKSYTYELAHLRSLGQTKAESLPLFITETGTKKTSDFYTPAFTSVWTETNIIAITPFLLFAATPDFKDFSLLDINHHPTSNYQEIANLPRTPASPLLNPNIPASLPILPPQPEPSSPDKTRPFWSRLKDLFHQASDPDHLQVGSTLVTVEVANTDASRQQGLSDRDNLPPNSGMVFTFPSIDKFPFWMKNMRFPLDMIWIQSGKVVEITTDVPPPSQTNNIPRVVTPSQSVDMVLEVNAGFVSTHQISVGDQVKFVSIY